MIQNSPIVVSLPKWKRSERTSQDTAPTSIIILPQQSNNITQQQQRPAPQQQEEESSNATTRNRPPCDVCRKNESRYNCPRCQLPYCSVDCYRNHTATTSSNNDDESNDNDTPTTTSQTSASACTEAFYKNRVSSIIRLETIEQQGATNQILNRHFQQQQEDDGMQMQGVSEEDLYELLLALENQTEETSMQDVQNLLSPSLKAAFDNAIHSGQLHDIILEPWHPWWRPELVHGNNATDGETETDGGLTITTPRLSSSLSDQPTLDERLLQIPPFSSLSKRPPEPLLIYHLVDILYSLVWTLRLYHGAKNAVHLAESEAATALVASSAILSCPNTTTFETLEQVLVDCTERSTRLYAAAMGGGGCNAHWFTLTQDVALLICSHRLVGRALLEAIDLIRAAIQTLKKANNNHNNAPGAGAGGEETRQQASSLRRIRKKLEFFLSWSQHTNLGTNLEQEIRSWMEHWKNEDELKEEESLILPTNKTNANQPQLRPRQGEHGPDADLLVEVQTTRKMTALD
jgi:hypothetical protein